MSPEFLILCALIFGQALCQQEGSLKGNLVFAQVLFRHGDRTPVDPYPTDPWRDRKFWPAGWGQLTNIGKMQQFQLGQWLRQRYHGIINETFSSEDLYVRSTDVDRTLMSALSNLAGLSPPSGKQVWDEEIKWQPIPVHTEPELEDEVLAGKKFCASYNHAFSKLKKSEEFKKIDKQFSWLYTYLSKHTGRNINSPESVERIYNTLFIEDLYNKTLPAWTKKVYPGGDMEWISAWTFTTSTYTRKLARLKSGPLLKEMLQHFVKKAAKTLKPDRSFWMYSGHDTTVANLLNTLKLFKLHSPPYTACVLLEMRLLDNVPLISVFYKNSSKEPLPLFIPECGTSCPLTKMLQLYADVLPDDWGNECKLSMLSMTYEEADVGFATAILFVVIFVLLLLILVYIGCVCYRRKHYTYYDYHLYSPIKTQNNQLRRI